ncbi:RhtB (resistance to homoserine/threonine) family protein [Bacillus sp. SLBN-46]|uniref:LysE family translocator n=1 Tax=Bacillus sp. SLBN-46 TaxID=3042283 RepID=UPI002864C19E|nr:LysE family translocator [Bacillus sp. SLBN-46]MDR6121560.1 RhtB (resistance to homoserine/threonine) family protein [Bacillus sp. SLBN-46]
MLSFILVVLVLFLIPGPAVLLTVTQTAKGGRKAGIITGVGIAVGDLIHTVAAVLGLSAILMTSALAFEIVKYLGAAYLIFLGIKSLLERTKVQQEKPTIEAKKSNPSVSFRQALLIELLNPKTALFFLAFLPQFVHNNGTPVVYQLLILGLTFVLMSILYTTLLAFLTSSIGERLFSNKNSKFFRWQSKVVGAIYIGLGLQLVLQSQE